MPRSAWHLASPRTPIRVLIADDEPKALSALRAALASDADVRVVGTAATPGEIVQVAMRSRPDVAVIDATLAGERDALAVLEIHETSPRTQVVALSSGEDLESVVTVIRACAASCVVKGGDIGNLSEAIRSAAQGMSVIAPEVAPRIAELLALPSERHDRPGSQPGGEAQLIRHVIDTYAFAMFFQPIVELSRGATVGFEALARFVLEPIRGPDAWVAAAYRVGLGVELEMACVEAALRRIPMLPPQCFLSVNVSPQAMTAARLAELMDRSVGTQIVLEMTEHAPVRHYAVLDAALDRLRTRGVRLAIDDVGAGFASLRNLLRLRPDFIKIDRSLCRHVSTAPGKALLEGLVAFAGLTDAKVVAEGIETPEELVGLRSVGVDFGQGFLLGAPRSLPRRSARRDRPGPFNRRWGLPIPTSRTGKAI
jgi:EAL domain-containing protein (putative c-di-GMP-specific phosphodiesterase class I)/DNA-binding NarL/FixJ family response regulator